MPSVWAEGESVKDEPKYTVYPTDPSYGALEALPEGSFFVIRAQDVFGAAALYGYAHLVQTGLDLDTAGVLFDDDKRKTLEHLVETATALAEQWQMSGDSKVPD